MSAVNLSSAVSTPRSGFFSYHLYLVSCGMTTNESYKWSECASLSFFPSPWRSEEANDAHAQLSKLRAAYLQTAGPLPEKKEPEEKGERQEQTVVQMVTRRSLSPFTFSRHRQACC